MTNNEIQNRLRQILMGLKGDPTLFERLSKNVHLVSDVGLDSLQIIEFMLAVEETFELELNFEAFDYSHLSSLEHFTAFIASHPGMI